MADDGGATVTAIRPATAKLYPLTDLGNARLLVAENVADIRFVPGVGWHVWDDRRWGRDVDGAILRKAKATVDRMAAVALEDQTAALNIADKASRTEAVHDAQRRFNHAMKSQGESRLRAMVSLAESELEVIVTMGALDSAPLLFNTPSGTVDLSDGSLRAHRREDLITRTAGAAYDADAIAPRWKQFLREIMAGDETRVAYLQRAIGYSVTGLVREQKIFMLLGDGANGKSVLGKTLVRLLGDYAAEVDFETFLIRERGSTRTDLVRLRGKRFGLASEMLPGEKLDTRRLKEWVGGEDVVARELYKSEVSFQPITKLWFLANCVPVVQDSSFGIWRRLVRLPFEVTIPENRRDPDLIDKLLVEGPGILRWIVEGCRAYLAEGLGEDPVARAATAAWQSDSDQVGRWLHTACIVEPGARVARRVLRAAYTEWCGAEDERPLGSKAFAQELRRRGIQDGGTVRIHGRPVDAWRGVRIRDGLDTCRDVVSVGGGGPEVSHEGRVLELYREQPTARPYDPTEREPGEDDDA